MNKEVYKFKNIIKECVDEIKKENDPKRILKESLRGIVKSVLNEFTTTNKPDPSKEETEKSSKMYNKNSNERLDKSNQKLQSEIETIVHGIDPSWEVFWNDHQQLIVKAQNMLYVRICPRFENNFDVDSYIKLVDNIRAVALTWDQVKAFIKANFGNLKNETRADDRRIKSLDNYKDKEVIKKDVGPRWDVIKNRGQENNGKDAKIKDVKKMDKDYNEPMTKREEDMPDKPFKQVTEPGKDPESKNKKIDKTSQTKPTKFKNDNKLRVSDKKTKKFSPKKNN